MLKRVGDSRHPCRTPTVVRNPVSYAAVEENDTSGLVIEVFDDLDKVCAVVVLFMVAHKAACQTLSKAFLKSVKTW